MLTSTSSSSPTTNSPVSAVVGAQPASQQHQHQYLRPEFLSSLPTTLDANKSPLALLAQTCSQIGADVGPTHPKLKSSSLSSSSSSSAGMTVNGYHLPGRTKKDSSSSSVSPVDSKSHHASPSPSSLDKYRALDPGEPEHQVSKKTKCAQQQQRDARSRESPSGGGSMAPSEASSDEGISSRLTNGVNGASRVNGGVDDAASSPKRSRVDSGASSVMAVTSAAGTANMNNKKLSAESSLAAFSSSSSSSSLSLAAAAAAMDAYKSLQHTSFIKPAAGDTSSSSLAAACFFPYAFQHPAAHHLIVSSAAGAAAGPNLLSPPYAGAPAEQPWSAASLAALRASMAASASYLSMAYSQHQHQHHHQHNRLVTSKTGGGGGGESSGSVLTTSTCRDPFCAGCSTADAAPVRPYVCNWINSTDPSAASSGPSYCGKCFASSEDLLAHLRTHTSAVVAVAAAAEQADLLYAAAAASVARTNNNPFSMASSSLSSSSASRFHPYAAPSGASSVLGLKSSPINNSSRASSTGTGIATSTSTSTSLVSSIMTPSSSSAAAAASSLSSMNPFYPGLFSPMPPPIMSQTSPLTAAASFAHFASMYPHLQPPSPSLTSLFTGAAPRL